MDNPTPYDPIRVNRTIYVGTDHYWQLRRVDVQGNVFIPSSVEAKILSKDRTTLWITPETSIDPINGWITFIIPVAATTDTKWLTRSHGVWDVDVVYNGMETRWVQGTVCVSQ